MKVRAAAMLLTCVLLITCRAAPLGPQLAGREECEREVVASLWDAEVRAVSGALEDWEANRPIDGLKLDAAVRMLSELSGVEGPVPNYVGYVPGDELRQALEKWKDWFKAHEDCLFFDPKTASLGRRKGCRGM